jgi:hypothetical protein
MRKILIGFVVVLAISVAAYFRFHRPKPPLETAYAGDRQVTVWSSTAQVREAVATANFGDRLAVISRFGDNVQVRTTTGVIGWVSDDDLLTADFWQKTKDLDAKIASLPVEARGHTRVRSNLHLDPGRDTPRIRQLAKDVPLDLFERRPVEVSPAAGKPGVQETAASELSETKREDWWLIRAHTPDGAVMGGWVLGRFIDLDVPQPLPDYASSAGMHIVAWFELNHVLSSAGESKPQYLVVGDRGAEGKDCDFTLMRAFTWGNQRERYETAFVESDLCGKLPVKLTAAPAPGGDASFSFDDLSSGTPQERLYRMHQTIIRRVRQTEPGVTPAASKKRPAKHLANGAPKSHVQHRKPNPSQAH